MVTCHLDKQEASCSNSSYAAWRLFSLFSSASRSSSLPSLNCCRATTEEEGVAAACGAWLGGQRSVLLMQSSGVGNCINMLSLPAICHMPLLMIVTMRGDWGESLTMSLPVAPLLAQRLGNSALLALFAWALSTVFGIGLGILAGLNRNRWPDRLISLVVVFFVSFPPFVVAVFMILVFALWLRWLPASSMIDPDANLLTSLRFLILPTLTLTLGALAEVARLMRASFIEVLESDYIRTARGKGITQQ